MDTKDEKIIMKLYVNGPRVGAQRIIDRIENLLSQQDMADIKHDLSVIDINEDPDSLEREQILATPTLIRETPDPAARLIGDLSDEAAVCAGLGLEQPSG